LRIQFLFIRFDINDRSVAEYRVNVILPYLSLVVNTIHYYTFLLPGTCSSTYFYFVLGREWSAKNIIKIELYIIIRSIKLISSALNAKNDDMEQKVENQN